MAVVFRGSFLKCGGEFESCDSGLDGLEEFGGAVIWTCCRGGLIDALFSNRGTIFSPLRTCGFGTRIFDGIVPRCRLQQVTRRDLTMISQSVLYQR